MAKKRKPSKKKSQQARKPSNFGRWLGLGALGLGVVAFWLRKDAQPRSKRPALPRPKRQMPASPEHRLDLDAELAPFFVSAPSGGLRMVDRAPASPVDEPLNVIFVHSLGGKLDLWAAQLNEAVERVRLIAFDLPGHGSSDPLPDGLPTMDDFVQSLAAVIENQGLRRVVLVGHSLGAAIATAYAARQVERVEGLLLVDPNGDTTLLPEAQRQTFFEAVQKDPVGEMLDYYRQILFGTSQRVEKRILAALRETSESSLIGGVEILMHYSPLADLNSYPGLFHAVYSEANDLPHSLYRLLPELPAQWLPRTGHWLMMDAPGEFAKILATFLNRVLDRRVQTVPGAGHQGS